MFLVVIATTFTSSDLAVTYALNTSFSGVITIPLTITPYNSNLSFSGSSVVSFLTFKVYCFVLFESSESITVIVYVVKSFNISNVAVAVPCTASFSSIFTKSLSFIAVAITSIDFVVLVTNALYVLLDFVINFPSTSNVNNPTSLSLSSSSPSGSFPVSFFIMFNSYSFCLVESVASVTLIIHFVLSSTIFTFVVISCTTLLLPSIAIKLALFSVIAVICASVTSDLTYALYTPFFASISFPFTLTAYRFKLFST